MRDRWYGLKTLCAVNISLLRVFEGNSESFTDSKCVFYSLGTTRLSRQKLPFFGVPLEEVPKLFDK